MIERHDALSGALDGVQLPAGARARIRREFDRDAPPDIAQWVDGYLSDFGISRGGGAQPSNPSRPPGPPVSGNGAPPPPPSLGTSEDTPLWNLSPEERAHIVKTKGPQYFRERYYAGLKGARVRVRNY